MNEYNWLTEIVPSSPGKEKLESLRNLNKRAVCIGYINKESDTPFISVLIEGDDAPVHYAQHFWMKK